MAETPPPELVATLERLGMASGWQVAQMRGRVARLARDLPRFDSVWIDAMAQAKVLTPFQAAEINAGRVESLRVGPYLLGERLARPYYAACYRAKNVESGEAARLAVVENPGLRADDILRQLHSLANLFQNAQAATRYAAASSPLSPLPSPLTRAGAAGGRLFFAEPWIEGRTAAEWIVHHGRFPPAVVLEIARSMLAQLVELEKIGVCHGDVGTASLVLTDAGEASLVLPGLRGILRPEEGYAHADLPPEAFDGLAPERIVSGTPPSAAGDIYACGCAWWHLLCGRSPLAGGSSLMKLRAAQAGGICDVRRYAPDVPPPLAAAIAACVETEPGRRPESMARLAAMLGSPTRNGKDALADCLARVGRPTVPWTTTVRSVRRSTRTPLWLAGAACCAAALLAIFWPGGQGRVSQGDSPIFAETKIGTVPLNARTEAHGPPPSPEVVAAAYREIEAAQTDLVLPSDRPVDAATLALRAGQRVCAPPGRRALLNVPESGFVVDRENVRFENIDFTGTVPIFVSAKMGLSPFDHAKSNSEPALVRLLAGHAEFHGCTFRGVTDEKESRDAPSAAPAIRWEHPADNANADIALPSGRIRFTDCVFDRVGAVDCRTIGAIDIEMVNSLHVGGGPLLRLDHFPRPDEPLTIGLAQVTLRDAGPLIECLARHGEHQPGKIAVAATACVFAPQSGEPLVRCEGTSTPDRWARGLTWTGQGSLVTPGAPIFTVRTLDGREQTIDEAMLFIAGLVRSEVSFAGRASSDPAASRALRWQAPLRSANSPGIGGIGTRLRDGG